MRAARLALVAAAALIGCGHDQSAQSGDPPISDGGIPPAGDGGFTPPGPVDDPVAHAAPTPIQVAALAGASGIFDVSADRGGGTWAVSPSTVYYWPPSGGAPSLYGPANGLARGSAQNPFASVGGGQPGQAVVGNRGAIADLITVDPATGALRSLTNMVVPPSSSPEYPEHLTRVVAGIRVAVDVDGTFDGTAYVGGTHGFVAIHGLDGSCSCAPFQEHQHFMPSDAMGSCDSTQPPAGCWGGDVKGLALSAEGDVWAGDEHFVALLPQRSLGAQTDFFQDFAVGIDVFPGVNDEVSALAVDAAGGVWVASFGQGLARLAPMTFEPSYFDRSRDLPMNRLTALSVDDDGSLWVGTVSAGIARRGSTGGWIYYTAASGLPSDGVSSLAIDRSSQPRRVLIGTDAGVSVYTGP
jgi:hypothetical protein